MIKTIIFDFGGVFIDLNKEATSLELERLGVSGLTPQMTAQNERYEKGLISSNEFLSFYKDQSPTATNKMLIESWYIDTESDDITTLFEVKNSYSPNRHK